MRHLVLSLFPGVGLFDRAFGEAGFCVVRGPDLLWGGDIRRFHPPAGRFDGVIGGPPCQRFSRLSHVVRAVHGDGSLAENLIPEYERVVAEAQPTWFVMENVEAAPTPKVPGYVVHHQVMRDHWAGGLTMRLRRFSFGTLDGRMLHLDLPALHRTDPACAVLANGAKRPKPNASSISCYGYRTEAEFREAVRLQGLPDDFDLPGFTLKEKYRAVGNGVPLAMGSAIANAVKEAMNL